MDASVEFSVRNTFLELVAVSGGGASQRKTRSESPRTRMSGLPCHAITERPCSVALEADAAPSDVDADCFAHRLIFSGGLGETLEFSGAESSPCPTPWSSQCGDWGYQDYVLAGIAPDLDLEAAFMGTP